VRIHPIRDGNDGHLFQACDDSRLVYRCREVLACRAAVPVDLRRNVCKFSEADMNRVLLKRAFAGLLSRLRTFDWQVIHGHSVGGIDGRGRALDVLA
jgi:hypothetical protein